MEQSEALQRAKSTTPGQMNELRNAALKKYGTTEKYGDAFYMLPNGQMLNGTGGYKGHGRTLDHRDINEIYDEADVDLEDLRYGGNTKNMLDFMRGGNIRMIPETKSLDIMSKPTDAQMNAIYRMWRDGKLDGIQISDPKTETGAELEFLDEIRNEAAISNLIRKYFK